MHIFGSPSLTGLYKGRAKWFVFDSWIQAAPVLRPRFAFHPLGTAFSSIAQFAATAVSLIRTTIRARAGG